MCDFLSDSSALLKIHTHFLVYRLSHRRNVTAGAPKAGKSAASSASIAPMAVKPPGKKRGRKPKSVLRLSQLGDVQEIVVRWQGLKELTIRCGSTVS